MSDPCSQFYHRSVVLTSVVLFTCRLNWWRVGAFSGTVYMACLQTDGTQWGTDGTQWGTDGTQLWLVQMCLQMYPHSVPVYKLMEPSYDWYRCACRCIHIHTLITSQSVWNMYVVQDRAQSGNLYEWWRLNRRLELSQATFMNGGG